MTPNAEYQAMADEYEHHRQELRALGIAVPTDEAIAASKAWIQTHDDWRAYRQAWLFLNDHDDRDEICPACGYRLGTYPGLCDTCHEWADT